MSKVSGFYGVESYDLILLLARLLRTAGASVVLVDNSTEKSLQYAIPGLNDGGVVEYDGLRAVSGLKSSPKGADYTLVYFGYNVTDVLCGMCDEVFLVTDYQKHNVERLKTVQLGNGQYPFLVLRDRVSSKITPEWIQLELQDFEIENEAVFELEDTEADLENKVLLQHNSDKKIKKPSNSMMAFFAAVLLSDFESTEIKKLMKGIRG